MTSESVTQAKQVRQLLANSPVTEWRTICRKYGLYSQYNARNAEGYAKYSACKLKCEVARQTPDFY